MIEQTVMQRIRVPARQVGASRCTDQQRIAGEQSIPNAKAHGVMSVPRRMQYLQTMFADHQHLTVVQPQIHEWCRARAMHRNGYVEFPGKLLGGGKMVGVGMRINQVVDAQTVTRGQRDVAVNQADFWIDERCCATFGATNQVGLTASGSETFEYHLRPPGKHSREQFDTMTLMHEYKVTTRSRIESSRSSTHA